MNAQWALSLQRVVEMQSKKKPTGFLFCHFCEVLYLRILEHLSILTGYQMIQFLLKCIMQVHFKKI